MELSEEQTQGLALSLSYALWNLMKSLEENKEVKLNDVKDAIKKFVDILELRGILSSKAIKPFIEKTMEEYSRLYIMK